MVLSSRGMWEPRGRKGEVNSYVQTPSRTRLRSGSAEEHFVGLHSRGDVNLLEWQVRCIIFLAACKANRDHLPRRCELSVRYEFWVLDYSMCVLCKRDVVHKHADELMRNQVFFDWRHVTHNYVMRGSPKSRECVPAM